MFKLAVISLLALAPTAAFAQQAAPRPPQTLLQDGQAPLHYTGWYVAPTAGFTSIKGDLGYIPGLRGAIMLNEKFGAGLAINFLGTDRTRLRDKDVREVGAYGGFYFQYVLRSTDLVHAYADATIGEGGWCQQSVGDDCRGRKFWLAEPTLNIEVNLTRNVRLATGLGYRFAIAEKTESGQSRRDLAGFVARTSLVVGTF